VNAYLTHPGSKLPVEFTLLQHRPEPWQVLDITAFSRIMIWQLSHAWYGEIVRAKIAEKVGPEHAAELEIHYPPANPASLPLGIEFHTLDPAGFIGKRGEPFLDRGKGSNTWAVAGWKSDTGNPVLCNDMHLALSLPSIWYEVHLHCNDFHVSGVGLPGLPLVQVGHNAHLGWGMTLAFTDCEDLFIEKFDPEQPTRYQSGEDWEEAKVIPESIKVKGRPQPHVEQVLVTRHGPVISDVVGYPEQRVAVCSMALRPCLMLDGWLLLNTAHDWDEFKEAMSLIDAPQLSVSYADVEGNIGLWVTGKVPIRAKGDGSVPAPGWSGEYEWIGEVPFEEMPHAFNPEQGFVVNANNKVVPGDYPYFLGEVWMNGYRARRIETVFRQREKLSIQDFQQLHMDFTSLPGQEFVACLSGLKSDDPDVRLALELLRAWDGQLSTGSVGGALYEVIRYSLARRLFDPGLGPELANRWMGQSFHPLLSTASEFYGHDTTTLLRLLATPGSWWLEQAGGREAALEGSLREAVGWLRQEIGPDPAGWQWGKLHRITFTHAMAAQKPLDQVFNRGPFPIGGDTDTVCQTATLPSAPYANNAWSPSVRFIFDLGDLSRSLAIYPPGQSGQLGSPHYDDLIDPWLKGEYHPMLWTREQVEEEAKHRLLLS
jgi:penicillin amidase